jgi:RHS repeat-associated protein
MRDGSGRLERVGLPGGKETLFSYESFPDEAHKVKTVRQRFSDGEVTYEYDRRGRRTAVTDQTGTIHSEWDQFGQITSVRRSIGPAIEYRYDSLRRLKGYRVGSEFDVEYKYDFLSRVDSIKTPVGTVRYEYWTGQGKTIRILPNGIRTISDHEPGGQLVAITHVDTKDYIIAKFGYSYRPDGLIEGILEWSPQGERQLSYEYDAVQRLATVSDSAGKSWRSNYDGLGNRTKEIFGDGYSVDYRHDWAGRLTSVNGAACAHDDCGNLSVVRLDGGLRRFEFDHDNRICGANGGEVRYEHDADGGLIARTCSGERTVYIPDPLSDDWHPLVELLSSGHQRFYLWEDRSPLAVIENGVPTFFLHDHIGSVRCVADRSGKISERRDYSAFGVFEGLRANSGLLPGFAGLFWDSAASVYLTRARAYSPDLGRFLQIDPQHRVPFGSQKDLSPYAYCGNDPVNCADRTGLMPEPNDDEGDKRRGPAGPHGAGDGHDGGLTGRPGDAKDPDDHGSLPRGPDPDRPPAAQPDPPNPATSSGGGGANAGHPSGGSTHERTGPVSRSPWSRFTEFLHDSIPRRAHAEPPKRFDPTLADYIVTTVTNNVNAYAKAKFGSESGLTEDQLREARRIGLQQFFADHAAYLDYRGPKFDRIENRLASSGSGRFNIDWFTTLGHASSRFFNLPLSWLYVPGKELWFAIRTLTTRTPLPDFSSFGALFPPSDWTAAELGDELLSGRISIQDAIAPTHRKAANGGVDKSAATAEIKGLAGASFYASSRPLTAQERLEWEKAHGKKHGGGDGDNGGGGGGKGGGRGKGGGGGGGGPKQRDRGTSRRPWSTIYPPWFQFPRWLGNLIGRDDRHGPDQMGMPIGAGDRPSGGGGAAALSPSPVGGVYLGGAGALLDGLGQVTGIATDQETGRLILLTEQAGSIQLPALRIDDLVTVFRSVYVYGEGPSVASATAERPLILFVDALDQLGAVIRPSALDWLPRELPPYVRVVVSVLESDGESGEALRSVRDRLPQQALLRLEEMPPEEAESVLDGWLAESARKLTTAQRGVVMESFRGCPTPLYLRLAFEEARKWNSTDPPEALAADAQNMVNRLVERWRDERQHGRALVDAFLGLLASSRYGLSEVEALDLLSTDEAVMRALSEHSVRPFPSTHLPTAVWVRLYHDVAPYLVSRMADGAPLMSFYHRLVAEVIAATQQRRERHDHLARYFRNAADPRGDGSWTGAATHALQELPFQLAQIDLQALLELLTDFAWLQAKVDRGLYGEAVADAKLGADQSVDDRSTRIFRLLSKTLQLARAAGRDHRQLAGQIVGRLFGKTESELARLVGGARAWRGGCWLCPEGPVLRPPSAAVEETLMGSGRSGNMLVAALDDPDRFVTAAGDGLLAIWSLREGREIEVLEAHSAPISLLRASPSGRYLLSVSEDGRIRLWKARKTGLEPAADWTEPLERVEKETLPDLPGDRGRSSWVAACFSADDSSFALAGVDQVIRVRKVDDLAHVTLLGAYHDDHSRVTSISASADGRLLASGSNDKTITVYDVARGAIHARLAGHREVVESVCLSADGEKLLSTGDGTARIWCVASRDHEVVSEDLGREAKLGVWTPDARSYVFADSLNRVLVVDAPDGAVRESFDVPGFAMTSATLSTDGAFVIACAFDQQVTILRLGTSGAAASLDLSEKLAKAIAIAPSADVVAVVVSSPMGMDQQMRLFHLPIARERFSTTAWTPGKGAMALLDGGRHIASVHEHGRTRAELSGGLKRWHWSRDHSIYTVCSASSLGGRWLAYLRSDGKVGLWDSQQEDVEEVATDAFRPDYRGVSQDVLEKEQVFRRFMRATRSVGIAVNDSGNCVASMLPAPELVASADEDTEVPTDVVTVWRRSRRLLFGPPKWKSKAFRLEGYEIRRIALSNDGNSVLTCLSSGEIGLLDCPDNTFMIVGSHFGEVVCAFLASDPLRALTASADRTVKVWDGVDGSLLAEFQADWPIVACAASSGFSRVVAFDQGGTLINLRLVSPADSPAASASQVASDAGSRVPRLVARTMDEVRAANLKGIEAEASGAVREACAWHRASFCGANRLLGYTHPWTQGSLRNLSDALLSVAPLEEIRKVEGAARRIGSAERRRARAKSEDVRRRYREMSTDVAHQMLEVLRTLGQEGEVGFRVTGDVSMRARLKIAPERLQQGIEWVTDFPRELIGRGPIALAAVLGLMDDVPSLAKAVLLYDFLEDIVLPFGATPKSTMLALKAVGKAVGRDLVCVKFDSGDWYGLLRIAPPFIVHLAQERFAAVTGYRDGLVEWSESGVAQTTTDMEFASMLGALYVLAPASSLPPPELWIKVPDPLVAFVWG